MNRLTSIENVRGRLLATDNANVNSLISDVLSATTLHLLDHTKNVSFDAASYTDVFYVQSGYENAQAGMPSLILRNGYVSSITSVNMSLVRTTMDTDGVDVNVKYQIVDLEKGIIKIDMYEYADANWYFEVKYDAGFTEVDGDYVGVPDRLQEVAIMQAMNLYRFTNDSEEEGFNVDKMIEKLIRWFPTGHQPVG